MPPLMKIWCLEVSHLVTQCDCIYCWGKPLFLNQWTIFSCLGWRHIAPLPPCTNQPQCRHLQCVPLLIPKLIHTGGGSVWPARLPPPPSNPTTTLTPSPFLFVRTTRDQRHLSLYLLLPIIPFPHLPFQLNHHACQNISCNWSGRWWGRYNISQTPAPKSGLLGCSAHQTMERCGASVEGGWEDIPSTKLPSLPSLPSVACQAVIDLIQQVGSMLLIIIYVAMIMPI